MSFSSGLSQALVHAQVEKKHGVSNEDIEDLRGAAVPGETRDCEHLQDIVR